MVEAVRTTQSTFGIWVIVAVAMIALAVWLVGVYVADSYQTRLSRLRRRADAPGPALGDAGVASSAIPSQRRDAGQPAPEPEVAAAPPGRHARPWAGHSETDNPHTARPQNDLVQTDFRRDGPLTTVETELQRAGPTGSDEPAQADAPTRPDLPAQPGQPTEPVQPAPTGRHAMPTQRSGDSDRAERTYAGPEANREDDEDQR
jgi:hypothetical protein